MTLLGLLIVLLIVGVMLWLINTFLPMDPRVKQILNAVVIIIVVIYVIVVLAGGIGVGAIRLR